MKKILLAAMAVIAFTSCSQDEEMDNVTQNSRIRLGAIVNTTTKAVVTDNSNFTTFTVVGYATDGEMAAGTALGTPFMPATDITRSGDAWATQTLDYYWPFNKQVQFFATSPAQTLTVPSAGYPTFDYTIKSTSTAQEDLLVAKVTDQTAATVSDNGVILSFTHALTQVNFSVKGDDDKTYKVNSIKIDGINDAGKYDFATGQWTPTESTASYDYPLAENAAVTGTNAVEIGTTNGALMLMPQTFSTGSKVTVTYQVFAGETPISDTITADAELNGSTAWTPSAKFRYIITLANKGNKIVLGTPNVTGWSSSETGINK